MPVSQHVFKLPSNQYHLKWRIMSSRSRKESRFSFPTKYAGSSTLTTVVTRGSIRCKFFSARFGAMWVCHDLRKRSVDCQLLVAGKSPPPMPVQRMLPTSGIQIACISNSRYTAYCCPARHGKISMRTGADLEMRIRGKVQMRGGGKVDANMHLHRNAKTLHRNCLTVLARFCTLWRSRSSGSSISSSIRVMLCLQVVDFFQLPCSQQNNATIFPLIHWLMFWHLIFNPTEIVECVKKYLYTFWTRKKTESKSRYYAGITLQKVAQIFCFRKYLNEISCLCHLWLQ